ncbi:MAG TPA: diguanylate cyclase, partial [Candidatus Methanoperedens sp.]|nr:diguanylate cyclase [Candidatus Methanoperedens sp.]
MRRTVRILIAEDSLTQATMMKLGLQRRGHEVLLARDGIEAIVLTWRQRPDLVVSDVVMPRLNGYQVCRLLRDDPATARIPVILLTSLDQRQDQFWGLKSGADRFVTKTGDTAALVAGIEGFITEHAAGAAARQAREAPAAGAEPGQAPPDADTDVMERVIRLLDRSLFESTLAAEIQDLVTKLDDLRGTVLGVLEILQRVVDFHIGAVLLCGEEEQRLLVRVARPVERRFLETLCDLLPREVPQAGPRPGAEIDDPQGFLGVPGGHPELPGAVLVSRLTSRGGTTGALAVAAAEPGAYPERVEKTFEMIVRQANIVIDYARLHERTVRLSITDGLTKLHNQRYFQEALRREFQRSDRRGSPLSLALLDIDHFKRFNDAYGHQLGDLVLQELARTLRGQVRGLDVLARHGGEEFAVVMPDTPATAALRVAERLRAAIEAHPVPGPEGPLRVTVSLGVASVPHPQIGSPEGLIAAADQALYRAKELGRNRV